MYRFEEDDDGDGETELMALSKPSERTKDVFFVPGLYPNWTEEHVPLTQYPNTPNVAPLKLPRAIVLVIGTDMQDNKRRMNAASRNTVAGVAARPRMLTLQSQQPSSINRNMQTQKINVRNKLHCEDETEMILGGGWVFLHCYKEGGQE